MLAALIAKPLVYIALFLLARARWRRYGARHWAFAVGAGLLRAALGVGLAFGGLLLSSLPGIALDVVFYGARFALWLALSFLVGKAPLWERLVLAAVGTGINFVFDRLLWPEGLQQAFDIRMC